MEQYSHLWRCSGDFLLKATENVYCHQFTKSLSLMPMLIVVSLYWQVQQVVKCSQLLQSLAEMSKVVVQSLCSLLIKELRFCVGVVLFWGA